MALSPSPSCSLASESRSRPETCAVEASMTAMAWAPEGLPNINPGSAPTAKKITGPIRVPMRKALVRTRSMNSRRMIAKSLDMGHLLTRRRDRRFRPDLVDEDRAERGRLELEAIET